MGRAHVPDWLMLGFIGFVIITVGLSVIYMPLIIKEAYSGNMSWAVHVGEGWVVLVGILLYIGIFHDVNRWAFLHRLYICKHGKPESGCKYDPAGDCHSCLLGYGCLDERTPWLDEAFIEWGNKWADAYDRGEKVPYLDKIRWAKSQTNSATRR